MVRSFGLVLALSILAPAQNPAPDKLPIKRVVLYKNGVGYFEHLGQVQGNQDVSILLHLGPAKRRTKITNRTGPERWPNRGCRLWIVSADRPPDRRPAPARRAKDIADGFSRGDTRRTHRSEE